MKNKKTLVLGASTKPDRYSFKAITMLVEKGHSVIAIGQNQGEVAGISIKTKNIPTKKYRHCNPVSQSTSPARILQLYHRNQTQKSSFQSQVPKIQNFINS
jgi:hypothetical protein